jgi:hypothetical protein
MPSRRNRAPISPLALHPSAAIRIRRRSAIENWRRRAVAATSGSGGAMDDASPVALRAPSNASSIASAVCPFIRSFNSIGMIQAYLSTLITQG